MTIARPSEIGTAPATISTAQLTECQRQVLLVYARAGSMKIAAERFAIAPTTVRATLQAVRGPPWGRDDHPGRDAGDRAAKSLASLVANRSVPPHRGELDGITPETLG